MISYFFPAFSFFCVLLLAASRTDPAPQRFSSGDADCALCFYGPDNIVFDSENNAYITDSDHKSRFRVLKVSPEGKFIDEWKFFEKVPGKRNGPEGIAIEQDGNLLVTDGGTSRVLRISRAGKVLGQIGDGAKTFEDLGHIAIDAAGNIFVAEAGPNEIQKFNPQGTRAGVWKRTRGSGPEEWDDPETIAVRADGTLVVEDWGNHRILVLSPTGHTLFSFGGAGDKPGEIARSAGMGIDRVGDIYVSDNKVHRIQKFDPSGRLVTTFAKDAGAPLFGEGPEGVTIDNRGNLYTVDALTIVKLSPDGHLLSRWK